MELYIHDGFDCKKENSEDLLRKVLISNKNFFGDFNDDEKRKNAIISQPILRTDKGKPYIEGSGIFFSISHSENIWVCAINNSEIGVDVQKVRAVNFLAIASRFFHEEEKNFIETFGEDGFFEIWVRKEAYVKYLGTGLVEGLSTFSVVKNGKLRAFTGEGSKKGKFITVNTCNGVKCTICINARVDSQTFEISSL